MVEPQMKAEWILNDHMEESHFRDLLQRFEEVHNNTILLFEAI